MTLPILRLKIQSLTCYTPSRFLRVRLMSLSLENWMISSLEVNERALVVVLEVMVLLFLTGTENKSTITSSTTTNALSFTSKEEILQFSKDSDINLTLRNLLGV